MSTDAPLLLRLEVTVTPQTFFLLQRLAQLRGLQVEDVAGEAIDLFARASEELNQRIAKARAHTDREHGPA